MGFKCGIVGLPNVGKSTLFNALTQSAAAEAANYPFCTIEPNIGEVAVPDSRLVQVAKIAHSKQVIPTRLTFVDIAGLVRGAAKGEGLGNRFLANIREVDAIAHVLRCFEHDDITHVESDLDPLRDAETVGTELMLADIESLERRIVSLTKKLRGPDKSAQKTMRMAEKCLETLGTGTPARHVERDHDDEPIFRDLNLLTSKPVLYVCNVDEDNVSGNQWTRAVAKMAVEEDAACVIVSAKIEAELAELALEEQGDYLAEIGLHETGLNRLIRAGYDLLGLITYFTAGPKEARAWTIPRGTRAPQAAGHIHSDFERGFIRAQTIDYDTYVGHGGEQGARDAGKSRDEGKEYIVQDGDVLLFKFAV